MANTVVLKRSAVQGKTPTTSDLALGELALNTYDGNLFFKRNVSSTETVVRVATNTNLLSYTRVTSNTTAVSRQSYIADTSGGTFTITLPASPASGDWVVIADGASFQTTALTVGRNSSTIADISENLSLNIEGVSVTFVYDGSTWEVYTQVGANGGDGTFTASSTTTFTNKTISGSSNTLSNIGNSSLTNSSISINGSAISLGGSVTGLVSTGDTGTVTNTMLAGSIANAKLANSSVTVNGTSISLGSSGTVTAAAGTLTGNTLASGVTASSLTSVGTLTSLSTSGSITSAAAAGTPTINAFANATSYANNATVDFANFSGMIVVNRQDSSGNVALWILGSGATVKLGDSSGSAVSGTFAHVTGINGYRWTNNTGGTVIVSFMAIKTRDGA